QIEDKEANKNIDRDDDRYWKLGQFYVNKNDPSIFIEKRFGVGCTINWAHPLSWVFIFGIIALPIIIVSILIYLQKGRTNMACPNLVMILAPFIIIQVILLITALVDLIKRPQTLGPKWLWAIIIICINILGPILYFIIGRKEN